MVRFLCSLLAACMVAQLAGCCAPVRGVNDAFAHGRDVGRDKQQDVLELDPPRDLAAKASEREIKSQLKPADKYGAPLKKKALAQLLPKNRFDGRSDDPNVDPDLDSGTDLDPENVPGPGAVSAPPKLLQTVKNVNNPQAVIFDQKRLRFYVSRLGGAAKPEIGAIALLQRDGSLIDPEWVKGLSQPRGGVVLDQSLFVCDGNELVEIDIEENKIVKRIKIEGAFYLDDVVKDDAGNLYISDPLRNSIHLLNTDGEPSLFVKDGLLDGPSRLAIGGGVLYVGSTGHAGSETSGTKKNAKNAKLSSSRVSGEQGGLFKIQLSNRTVLKLTNDITQPIAGLALDGAGHIYAAGDNGAELIKVKLSDGRVVSQTDLASVFKLNDAFALGDFHYFNRSKEFWMPIKSNGHILVFAEGDAAIVGEDPLVQEDEGAE